MHDFIEIPSGSHSQPIGHLQLWENFRKFPPNIKFPENLQPYLYMLANRQDGRQNIVNATCRYLFL